MKHFDDITAIDFECPEGKPWDESEVPCNGKERKDLDQQFENIALEADKMDGELWDTLKVQIRGSKMAIELHPENSPCWKAKQKIRVIEMYQKLKGGNVVKVAVAMLLMLTSLTFAASTNVNQIVTRHTGDNKLYTNNTEISAYDFTNVTVNVGNIYTSTQWLYYANTTNYVYQTSDSSYIYWTRATNGVVNVKTNSLL